MSTIEGLRHVFPEHKLALFVNPKVGSTSIAKWYLYQRDFIDIHNLGKTPGGIDVHTNTNIVSMSTPMRLAQNDLEMAVASSKNNDWTCVKFVRNPYNRMVSAFFQILTLMRNDVELSFREFVNLPRYYFSNSGVPHINTGDPHARLQATTAEIKGELSINKVFQLEEGLPIAFKWIENHFNLKDTSQLSFKENISHEKNAPIDDLHKDSSADLKFSGKRLIEGIQVPSTQSLLNDDIKEAIYDRYKDDFDIYGFDRESGELCSNHSGNNFPLTDCMRLFLEQPIWDETYSFQKKTEFEYESSALRNNLNKFQNKLKHYQTIIDSIPNQEPIIVYGAGFFLLDLILYTTLKTKNVVGVTDSNLSGIAYPSILLDNLGWNIIHPDLLKERLGLLRFNRILIASSASEPEISKQLSGRLYGIPKEKIIKF